ncbi:hypothetical protein LJD22_20510, partial [Bacillus velezensis]|nr:hypothetical protein [Bacillus velezensis]
FVQLRIAGAGVLCPSYQVNLSVGADIAASAWVFNLVEAELTKMAEAYNMPVENIKQAIGSTDAMKEDLKVRKAIDFLVENR